MTDEGVERFELRRTLDLQVAVLRCQRSTLLHGASDLERSVVATIVSELGSNVLKYASGGTLELRRLRRGLEADVEITVRDSGPGIGDVELALTDHYSSSRSLGLGLPAVRRMADALEIDTHPSRGTTVRVRKRLARGVSRVLRTGDASESRLQADAPRWSAAATVRARRGHRHAGDVAVVIDRDRHVLLAVIDATGHGPAAHALAATLATQLREGFAGSAAPDDVAALLHDLHESCIGTPGAAAGLAVIDTELAQLRFLAIGNVRSAVIGRERFTGVSRDGVLGRRWPTPFVQRARLHRGDLLMLWTDGLTETLARGLAAAAAAATPPLKALDTSDPTALADELIATHAKAHDDAACLVARWRA